MTLSNDQWQEAIVQLANSGLSAAAMSATGGGVPGSADYIGFNSSGTLVGVSSANPLPTVQTGALPAGTNVIGHVIVDTAPTTAVTGTFWQATQPVSIASMPSTPVTGTFWQTTQPVSIASLPALPANQSSNVAQWGGQSAPMAGSDAQTAANTGLLANGVYNGTTVDRWASDGTGKGKVSLYVNGSGTAGDTAVASDSGGHIQAIPYVNGGSVTKTNVLPVAEGAPLGTPVDASATGTNATTSASLAAVSAKTQYITGFEITALAGTSAGSGDVTITGLNGGTETWEFASDTTRGGQLIVQFSEPRQASAVNTAIQVSVAALGASSGKVSVAVHGHYF